MYQDKAGDDDATRNYNEMESESTALKSNLNNW